MKLLVVTGSSGGHIFPAIAFLDCLKERRKDVEVLLIIAQKPLSIPIDVPRYKTEYICLPALRLKINLGNLKNVILILKAFLRSISIFFKYQPDIVVGFGGLLSVPVVMTGWLLRRQTLIHEQNVIPGKANRLLGIFADKVAVSFRETYKYLGQYKSKIALTGNPLRKDLSKVDKFKALDFFGLGHDKLTILVMGGSQGSQKINLEFLNAVKLLQKKADFQVIHLSGNRDYDSLSEKYKNLDIKFFLSGFFKDMRYAYSASDLVLSRSGATSVSELIYFGLPAILIPYPYAYQHQLENAKILEEKGCALIIGEQELSSGRLKAAFESFLDNPLRLNQLRDGFKNFQQASACDLLADEVLRN